MVEGPGCKLKGEKMKETVVGQKVKDVTGTAVMGKEGGKYSVFVGRTITDVRTLGKELFVIVDSNTCLRVHFLMDGFVRYNRKTSYFEEGHPQGEVKDGKAPKLEVECTKAGTVVYIFSECS